ncbi:MAG: hypothetical protein ACOY3P_18245, partial [Planctomycetota bacterium]
MDTVGWPVISFCHAPRSESDERGVRVPRPESDSGRAAAVSQGGGLRSLRIMIEAHERQPLRLLAWCLATE